MHPVIDESSEKLAQRIYAMPKIELHVHIEGTISPQVSYQMAQKNRLHLPVQSFEEWISFHNCHTFDQFIKVFTLSSGCLSTRDDYVNLLVNFLAKQSEQNILYSEVSFSPTLHLDKLSVHELVEAFYEGALKGEEKYGSRLRIIAELSQDLPESQSAVLEVALEGLKKKLVIGIGIAGSQIAYPLECFQETFSRARKQGLHVVAHADHDARSIWEALNIASAERIGHGIGCLEDKSLAVKLATENIPLEICPTSERLTSANKQASITELIEQNILCTVNSDDPAIFNTTLSEEYLLLAKEGLTWDTIWQLNCNSLEASFLDASDKNEYRHKWQSFCQSI